MSGIVEWLLEQVAADEAIAAACSGHGLDWRWSAESAVLWGSSVTVKGDRGPNYDYHANGPIHMANWDPRRVLAECKAKRAIIELHIPEGKNGVCYCGDSFPCWTLCVLAGIYLDREGYEEAWKWVHDA